MCVVYEEEEGDGRDGEGSGMLLRGVEAGIHGGTVTATEQREREPKKA